MTEFKSIGYPLDQYQEEPKDICFPKEIFISFAVCSKECGNSEFIVDGSTQICEYCGKNMFRTEVRKYKLVE